MQRRLLRKEEVGSVERQIAVYFVCRYLMITFDPILAAGVHEHRRADNVRFKENARIFDGTIYMTLRGEVDHNIGFLLLKELVHRLPIADIRPHKAEVGVVHHASECGEIPRIRELIQAHDAVIGIFPEHMKDEVTADKSGTAGHDDRH